MSQVSTLSRGRRTDRPLAARTAMSASLLNYVGFGLSLGFAAALILGFVA